MSDLTSDLTVKGIRDWHGAFLCGHGGDDADYWERHAIGALLSAIDRQQHESEAMNPKWYPVPAYKGAKDYRRSPHIVNDAGELVAVFEDIKEAELACAAVNATIAPDRRKAG